MDKQPVATKTPPPRGLTNKQIKQSLKYATIEGTAAAGMVGFSEQYVTPFAVAAEATRTQIGLLNSIPNFLTIFFTLKAQSLVEKIGSRKKTIMLLVFLDIFSVFPLLFVPVFVGKNFLVWFILLSFYYFFPPIMINPIWGSMMADIVPPKRMGRYFSRRSLMVGLSTLVSSSIAAAILTQFGDASMTGFTIIFSVAVVCRVVSLLSYARIHEPPVRMVEDKSFGFLDFVKESKSSSLVKFIIFVSLMNFTLNLAGPFHMVYLIENLNMPYWTYMIVINASAVATMLTLGYWGRRADQHGNVRVIKTSAFLMPIAPVLWLISGNPVFLAGVQLLAGFAWAGFNLCGPNFIYEAAPKEKRGRYLAYFSAVNMAALSLGALAGGVLSNYLPRIQDSRFLTLFLLTGVVRLAIAIVFVPQFREVRFARESKRPALFYNTLSVSPGFKGLFHNPLAYKPIVAAAETYVARPTSPYSPFYRRVAGFVTNTASDTSDDGLPVFHQHHDLYHNQEAAKKAMEARTHHRPGSGPREVSRWTPFKKSPLGRAGDDDRKPHAIGDDEVVAEEARRHLEMLKRQAREKRQTPQPGESPPVTLYHNQEMQKQIRAEGRPDEKKEPSRFVLFKNRPEKKAPVESGEKVNKRGLFYRQASAEDLMKKKKKR